MSFSRRVIRRRVPSMIDTKVSTNDQKAPRRPHLPPPLPPPPSAERTSQADDGAEAVARAAAEAEARAAAEADAQARAACNAVDNRKGRGPAAAEAEAKAGAAAVAAIVLHAQKAPPASPAPPRTVTQARLSRAVLSMTALSIIPCGGRLPLASLLLHAARPACAKLGRPSKPPPSCMRPCSLLHRQRRRPGNGHVPIKPSVPPPCKSDDPEVRVHGAKVTRLDRPIY